MLSATTLGSSCNHRQTTNSVLVSDAGTATLCLLLIPPAAPLCTNSSATWTSPPPTLYAALVAVLLMGAAWVPGGKQRVVVCVIPPLCQVKATHKRHQAACGRRVHVHTGLLMPVSCTQDAAASTLQP